MRNPAEERNRKIIGAVIEKAKNVCPGSLALIGIYGSFLTGDTHPGSDLDLLILINDDRGWQLASAFIQEDQQIGHDLYCATWDGLKQDAEYRHPHIARLLDSKIVWCAEERYRRELEAIRQAAREKLAAPFGWADYENAERTFREAELEFARAIRAEELSETRGHAGGAVYCVEDALALLNKAYFRFGVKRRYEELSALKNKPDDLCGLIDGVVSARDASAVKECLVQLMKAAAGSFRQVRESLPEKKKPVSAETVCGTYEEMYSNWRNKMALAAAAGNRHLAFMSLVSLDGMFREIAEETQIGRYDAMTAYDPDDLPKTAEGFDAVLRAYQAEYKKAGLTVKRYADIDVFAAEYAKSF